MHEHLVKGTYELQPLNNKPMLLTVLNVLKNNIKLSLI